MLGDSKRTWVCPPAYEERIRALVEAHDLEHVITVRASIGCPENQVLIIDEQAMEADLRAQMARPFEFIAMARRSGKSTLLEEYLRGTEKCAYNTDMTCSQVMERGNGICCRDYASNG